MPKKCFKAKNKKVCFTTKLGGTIVPSASMGYAGRGMLYSGRGMSYTGRGMLASPYLGKGCMGYTGRGMLPYYGRGFNQRIGGQYFKKLNLKNMPTEPVSAQSSGPLA